MSTNGGDCGDDPPSEDCWEGPPRVVIRPSASPSSPNDFPLTPRCGPPSLDGGWLALLLEQLHRYPQKGAPIPEGPKGPRVSVDVEVPSDGPALNASSSSPRSSTRDELLQMLADEIMPQFLADPSVQQLASLLQQQQTPADLTQALETEIAKLERLLGPPLSQNAGAHPLSVTPNSVRGRRASPTQSVGPPKGAPSDAPAEAKAAASGSPVGTPRQHRGSEPPREGALGAPVPLGHPDPGEHFVTPVGPPESPVRLRIPAGAFESPTLPEDSSAAAADPPWAPLLSSVGPQEGAPPPCTQYRKPVGDGGLQGDVGKTAGIASMLSAVRTAREKRGLRAPPTIDEETEAAISAAFDGLEGGMTLEIFREKVVEPLLGLGPFMAGPLFGRVDTDASGTVTPEKLKAFWTGRLILRSKDPSLREGFPLPPLPTYKASCPDGVEGGGAPPAPVIRRGSLINFMGALATKGQYIYPEDLRPWVLGREATTTLGSAACGGCAEVAECAPDMAFLLDPQSAEYLERYIDSVVARIMFYVDEESKLCLSMKDLRRSSLVHIWCSLNPSMELSAVRSFFRLRAFMDLCCLEPICKICLSSACLHHGPISSLYDHFYVFYYAFHELDEDEDFLLHRSDVAKYQGHSMSSLVEARIFSQVAHRFKCEKSQHMNFDDWIWFVLAYHEVTFPKALRFWFDIFDLDGDGYLRDHELEAAFESQAERLRMRDGKAQTYKEFICQVSDALGVPSSSGISCRDFLRAPVAAGFLVNCLVKCEVLRAFDEGEAVVNLVQGSLIERAVLFNFSPFDIYAHSEYAAITAQRFEEQVELADQQEEGLLGEKHVSDEIFDCA